MDYFKLKCFCTAKQRINTMKRQSMEWQKIFSNHISDNRLISKIYVKHMQLIAKKWNNQIKNGQKTWIDIFQWGYTNGQQVHERGSKSLFHQRNANQNHNQNLTSVRMAIIKRQEITNAGEEVEKRDTLCIVGGIVNWYSHYGKQFRGYSKN